MGKVLAKQLADAVFELNGELKRPDQMCDAFTGIVSSVEHKDLCCTTAQWQGCVNSNLEQIRRGDLWIDSNTYTELGKEFKVVSTSQLEGVNAALRRLLNRTVSYEVGTRILDVFLLEVRSTCK